MTEFSNSTDAKDKSMRSHFQSFLLFAPILLIVAILPIIMRYHEYQNGLTTFDWFSSATTSSDYFLFYKQWFFVGLCGILFIIAATRCILRKQKLKFAKMFIPLFIYALCALFSTLLSDYKNYSLSGGFEQFENVFCLLGYVLVAYYIFISLENEFELHLILRALSIGALLVGIIGISQFFGHNLINTDLGKTLIFGTSDVEMSFAFEEGHVFSTLYNPNYVGVYSSMILPIFCILAILSKDMKDRLLYLAVIITNGISLYGSRSKTSILSISFALFILFLLFAKRLKGLFRFVIITGVLGIAAFFTLNAINQNQYTNKIFSLFNNNSLQSGVTEIDTNDDAVVIKYNNEILRVSMVISDNMIEFVVLDDDYNTIETTLDGATYQYHLSDDRFSNIYISPIIFDDALSFTVNIDGLDWYFTNQVEDNTYYYINAYGKYIKPINAQKALPSKFDTLATSRGYIWSCSIPLLKDTLLFGTGADTFIFYYPHNDVVGLTNAGFNNQLLTKPHCLYLQIGIQTGVVSLLALLLFYMMYFISCFKLYFTGSLKDPYVQAGIALFIGTTSYMFSGLTNDSMITVAPTFWVIIGLGVTVNRMVREQKSERKSSGNN